MATVERLELTCDNCGGTDTTSNLRGRKPTPVRTHRLVIDGKKYAMEACETCWPKLTTVQVQELADKVTQTGRRIHHAARRQKVSA